MQATALRSANFGTWRAMCVLSVGGGVVAAVAYLVIQVVLRGGAADPIFVGLLVANAVTAYRFGLFLQPQIAKLITEFNTTEYYDQTAIDIGPALERIFNSPRSVVFAVLFAGLIAGGAVVLAPWAQHTTSDNAWALNAMLAVVLFFSNLIIGYSVACIFRFWGLCSEHIAAVRLKILNASRPDLVQFQWMTKMIVIVSALISCLAVTSLVFSVFTMGPLTIFFSVMSFVLVGCTYFVPIAPLSRLFRAAKLEALNAVELDLSTAFSALKKGAAPDDARLSALINYRDEVRAIRTLPPGGDFSLWTVASVSLVTFLPILFEHLVSIVTSSL